MEDFLISTAGGRESAASCRRSTDGRLVANWVKRGFIDASLNPDGIINSYAPVIASAAYGSCGLRGRS